MSKISMSVLYAESLTHSRPHAKTDKRTLKMHQKSMAEILKGH